MESILNDLVNNKWLNTWIVNIVRTLWLSHHRKRQLYDFLSLHRLWSLIIQVGVLSIRQMFGTGNAMGHFHILSS